MRFVFAVVVALAAAGSALGASGARPTLSFLPGTPVRVHGAHFTPRSVVRVFGAGSTVSKVRVTARGTFTLAVFPPPDIRCTGFVVQALGAHGERASVGVGAPACDDAGIGDTTH